MNQIIKECCGQPESQQCGCDKPVREPFISEHLTKTDVLQMLNTFLLNHPGADEADVLAHFFEQGVLNERSK